MVGETVGSESAPDGTVVIHPRGVLGTGNADELRRTVVHTIRHTRPARLIVDLRDIDDLDPINLGALAAACQVGDDHDVAVLIDHSSTAIAEQFLAAGVAAERLRHVQRDVRLTAPGDGLA